MRVIRFFTWFITTVWVVWWSCAMVVLVQDQIGFRKEKVMPDLTDFRTVLIWLAGVGGPYVIAYAMALLAENWPKWHELPRIVKFLVPILGCIMLSVGATLLLGQQEIIEAVSPWFALIMLSIIGWIGSQKGYMSAKASDYARTARK